MYGVTAVGAGFTKLDVVFRRRSGMFRLVFRVPRNVALLKDIG